MPENFQQSFVSLPKFGTGIGLHRLKTLSKNLGIDLEQVSSRALVITGSNGKGSTAKISSELLRSFYLSVGLFTSPHLYRYNERFQINGSPIEDQELQALMAQVIHAIGGYEKRYPDKAGAFEAQFLLALLWFTKNDVDIMVLEAGIGGRYDPVRIVKSTLTALVSLDYEHTELLGNSLQAIAFDKMDACFNGGYVVCGVSCDQIRGEIDSYAWARGITAMQVEEKGLAFHGIKEGYQNFSISLEDIEFNWLKSRLAGEHQINNHAIAIELCCRWLKRAGKWDIRSAQAYWPETIEKIEWPGRLEKVCDEPLIYVDVGHTPEGIKAALSGFKSLVADNKALLVTGGSANKKVEDMIALLVPEFPYIICASAYHNGASAAEVAAYVKKANPSAEIVIKNCIEDAVKHAVEEAKSKHWAIYVAGGLFLATEFAHTVRGGDPKKLKFF